MTAPVRLAGVEYGGTKSIAALAEGGRIIDSATLPTAGPEVTLHALRAQIDRWHAEWPVAAVGIASFGPLQLERSAPGFGRMLATPKPGWTGVAVAEILTAGLGCAWAIDTDVNGAALAEYRQGAGKGCDAVCYVTVGTGVGGGLVIGGEPIHGAMHPEIGHLRLRRSPGDDFGGACPFHGDCVEGLICGPALSVRFGREAPAVADSDPRWRHVASDIAELCGAVLLTVSAQRILFGGSVAIHRPFLLPLVRERVVAQLGSYLPFLTRTSAGDIIQPAGLGADAGPLGALALAEIALDRI